MKKRLYKIVGTTVLIFTLVTNLQYAITDYGLKTSNLGSQLMAQADTGTGGTVVDEAGDGTETSGDGGGSTSGGGDSSGGGAKYCYDIFTYPCDGGGFGIQCTFTGKYGSPTTCQNVGCGILGVIFGTSRRCVKK